MSVQSAAEDDGALGVGDEFDIYEELQLNAIPSTLGDRLLTDAELEAQLLALAAGEIAPLTVMKVEPDAEAVDKGT